MRSASRSGGTCDSARRKERALHAARKPTRRSRRRTLESEGGALEVDGHRIRRRIGDVLRNTRAVADDRKGKASGPRAVDEAGGGLGLVELRDDQTAVGESDAKCPRPGGHQRTGSRRPRRGGSRASDVALGRVLLRTRDRRARAPATGGDGGPDPTCRRTRRRPSPDAPSGRRAVRQARRTSERHRTSRRADPRTFRADRPRLRGSRRTR